MFILFNFGSHAKLVQILDPWAFVLFAEIYHSWIYWSARDTIKKIYCSTEKVFKNTQEGSKKKLNN